MLNWDASSQDQDSILVNYVMFKHLQTLIETSPTVQTYLMPLFILTTHPSSLPPYLVSYKFPDENICHIHSLILFKTL